MSAACVAGIPNTGLEPVPDRIELLIPGDQTVLEAVFPSSDGLGQTALVHDPYISVIPANRPHCIHARRQGAVILLALDAVFYREKVRAALGVEPPEIALRHAVIDSFLRELGNTLRNEFHMLQHPGNVYLDSLAAVVAIHLAATYGRDHAKSHAHAGLPPHKLDRVLAFIEDHIADAVPVDDLASSVHMSPCHFARMFKQTVGQPPHVYITRQRMERAKELLRNTDLPLVDVAASAGFQTQAHFTGVFRKHAGVTPRIFRLRWQAQHPGQACSRSRARRPDHPAPATTMGTP